MLSLVCNVFDAYTVTYFLPVEADGDEDKGVYELAAYFSLGDAVAAGTRLRAGQGHVGWVLGHGKPLDVPNCDGEQNALYYYVPGEEETIRSFMGAPLPSGGALCVDTKRQFGFTEKESKHLQMFASILDSVHKLTAFDRQISEIPLFFSQFEAMADLLSRYRNWGSFISSFLGMVAEGTGFDYCALATVEVPGESYSVTAENQTVLVRNGTPFYQSFAHGIVGWVFRNGQTVIHSGEEGGAPSLFGTSENLPAFAAVACLPVFINKGARACLCLGHTRVHPVSRAMRSFMRGAATLLSLHSENLYLHNRISATLDSATVYRSGPRAHDPDTEPYRPAMPEED